MHSVAGACCGASLVLHCLVLRAHGTGAQLQVGKKLRDGEFGATFVQHTDTVSVVTSARPGRRLWLADSRSGVVESTLKFSVTQGPDEFVNAKADAGASVVEKRRKKPQFVGRLLPVPRFMPQAGDANTALPPIALCGESGLLLLHLTQVNLAAWHTSLGSIHGMAVRVSTSASTRVSVAAC